jgi:hypothetical protein
MALKTGEAKMTQKRLIRRPAPASAPATSALMANSDPEVTRDEALRALAVTSVIAGRSKLAARLGKQFGGNRDIYEACGYRRELLFADYYNMYTRQDIARRVVDAYPDATWRGDPSVSETEDPEPTTFEETWAETVKRVKLYHYLKRLDRAAGIGHYACLFLGFAGRGVSQSFAKEVTSAKSLRYVQVYTENQAKPKTWETKKSSDRYGKPLTYEFAMGNASKGSGSKSVEVHWTRVIHVADGALTNDLIGTPRQECVFNRLEDLMKITGGSAEGIWQGGFGGISFEADEDADLEPQDVDDLEDEISKYMHGYQRYLRLQGMSAKQLKANVANPKEHAAIQVQMISAATGIPQRILTGSERGELSSSKDQDNFNNRVEERREDFAEPMVLVPIIERLQMVGILDENVDPIVEWPEMNAISEKDRANNAKTWAEAITTYIAKDGQLLIPPFNFLTDVMGMDDEKANEVLKEAEKLAREHADEEEADALAEQSRIEAAKLEEQRNGGQTDE